MRRRLMSTVAMMLATAALAAVQPDGRPVHRDGTDDDRRFTFVRLRWSSDLGRSGWGFRSAWNHDYPRADRHLALILEDLTAIDMRVDTSLVLPVDDPELFHHPVSFMWEPGFWVLSDEEALAFRAYLLKGGFVVFEDFDGPEQWGHFEAQMRRVLPDGHLARLDPAHPIFNSFFRIHDIHAIAHPMMGLRPSYFGIFEDNDPSKRLMVVANFDNDVPEYWEWSGEGLYPVDTSSEAYKLGVNYVVYGLTH